MINVAKFVSVLAVFICAVAGTVWSAVAAERSAATRAFEKLEIADGLLAAMLAREGALRGYFLTKDASFLEPYDEASLELAEAADLARTGADGEAERASVAAQERLAERWIGGANDAIIRTRNGREVTDISVGVRTNLTLRFRTANDELRRLINEQAEQAHGNGLKRTVALFILLSAVFSISVGLLLHRLRRQELGRQAAEQTYHAGQRDVQTLQVTENEAEAHALVKRHLERALPGSDVVVLNRSNSQNRLLATTPVDPGPSLAERLAGSAPTSCLAICLGRIHEQSADREPLLACSLCGREPRSTCVPSVVGGDVIGSVLVRHEQQLADRNRLRIAESVNQAAPVLANLRNLAVAEVRAATDALTGLSNARAPRRPHANARAGAAVGGAARGCSVRPRPLQADQRRVRSREGRWSACRGERGDSSVRPDKRSRWTLRRRGVLILLPDTPLDGAVVTAEKLREALLLVNVPGVDRAITASFGVAVFPTDAPDPEMRVRMADRALYAAKSRGRNCVVTAGELVVKEPSP